MSTTITPTAADPSGQNITGPADGDVGNAASVLGAFQSLLNFVAWLRSNVALLSGATFTGPVNGVTPTAPANLARMDYVDGLPGRNPTATVWANQQAFAGGLVVKSGATTVATLDTTGAATFNGDVTANASDRRLKTNIRPIAGAVERVKRIGGYLFDWDREACDRAGFPLSREHDLGVVAQEIEAVLPEAVAPAPFDNRYLTVRYDKLTALLIQAVKEQQGQIEQLSARIAEMEEK